MIDAAFMVAGKPAHAVALGLRRDHVPRATALTGQRERRNRIRLGDPLSGALTVQRRAGAWMTGRSQIRDSAGTRYRPAGMRALISSGCACWRCSHTSGGARSAGSSPGQWRGSPADSAQRSSSGCTSYCWWFQFEDHRSKDTGVRTAPLPRWRGVDRRGKIDRFKGFSRRPLNDGVHVPSQHICSGVREERALDGSDRLRQWRSEFTRFDPRSGSLP